MTTKLVCLAVLLTPGLASAQGGPPMVTDDPGTVDKGHWEINIAGLLNLSSDQDLLQTPYFDINYGLSERVQLKMETGWVFYRDGATATKNGSDTLLVGTKIRFLDEQTAGIAVSTYPQFQFHHFFSSSDPELTQPGNQYILPIEVLKGFGSWEINPDFGYIYCTAIPSQFFYGTVLAYENLKPWEPLLEVHANTNLDGTGTATLLNLGFRYTFNREMNLLAALGHTVTHVKDSATELEAYLGIQLEL